MIMENSYFYVRNAQGDIIGLIDKAGAQVASYTYDSWGKLISIEGTLKDSVGVKNPYRYRGYRYDTETGLYYLQSRYYNPEWGRFISTDAIVGQTGELLGHNMFAYCKNNPINRKGDTGLLSSQALDNFGGGGGGGGAGVIPIGSAFQDCLKGLWYGFAGTVVGIGKAISFSSSKKSTTKSKTISAPITNSKKQQYDYFAASTKNGGGINISNPLTLAQAQTRVLAGKDIYARTQLHAVYLANTLGGTEDGPDDPDIHTWSPHNKYHYHLQGHVGGHIFFDK